MTCRLDAAVISSPPPPRGTPLPAALDWIADDLDALRTAGLERPHRVRSGRQGREVDLDGQTLLNFGSNDYLGLAGDVRLTKAASKAACAEGFGAGASPLVSGHSQAHELLERALADLLAVDGALTFPSGFAANTATIAALVGPDDFLASDARNHASIIDGCRLSRGRIGIYPHRDMAALDSLLSQASSARRRLIVTDTVFSMDGTIAPLADLCELARKHRAILMVDEAHATGVFGQRGSGLVEEAGCADGVHVRVGTLSKALATAGGFVAGHADMIHWLRHTARAWIFSTAHPPAVAAAATRAILLVAEEPYRRQELRARASEFRDALQQAGVTVSGDPPQDSTQIVPIVVGAAADAVVVATRLAEAGLFVPAIRPPSVPVGKSLVRVSLSWHHTTADIARLASTITSIFRDRAES
jgi:8-amino-7-oxononanoate synthase